MIGDNIELVVIESSNNLVKLGIVAPKEISVYREEIYLEIKKANELSKKTSYNSVSSLKNIVFNTSAKSKNEKLDAISTKVKMDE